MEGAPRRWGEGEELIGTGWATERRMLKCLELDPRILSSIRDWQWQMLIEPTLSNVLGTWFVQGGSDELGWPVTFVPRFTVQALYCVPSVTPAQNTALYILQSSLQGREFFAPWIPPPKVLVKTLQGWLKNFKGPFRIPVGIKSQDGTNLYLWRILNLSFVENFENFWQKISLDWAFVDE